jgi:hypothetical protein
MAIGEGRPSDTVSGGGRKQTTVGHSSHSSTSRSRGKRRRNISTFASRPTYPPHDVSSLAVGCRFP